MSGNRHSLQQEAAQARRRDFSIGVGILAVTFSGSLGLSWWAKQVSSTTAAEPPGPPTVAGVAGYPTAVNPKQALEAARALTRRPHLRGFVAEAVQSNGIVDLREPASRIRYLFDSPPGYGPRPRHQAGESSGRRYCGRQNVHLRKSGLAAGRDVRDYPCPARLDEPLPDPRCGPVDVWRHALEQGAPSTGRARIEYYRAAVGPAWRFALPGTRFRFSLYGDCQRELLPADAVGAVR